MCASAAAHSKGLPLYDPKIKSPFVLTFDQEMPVDFVIEGMEDLGTVQMYRKSEVRPLILSSPYSSPYYGDDYMHVDRNQ